MKHESEWDSVVNAENVKDPVPMISKEEVKKALASMHNGKANGPSGVVKEHFETSLHGIEVLHKIVNNVLLGDSISDDWRASNLIPIYKGKGSAMECDSYWG